MGRQPGSLGAGTGGHPSFSWLWPGLPPGRLGEVSGSKHKCKVTPSLLDPCRPVASFRLAHGCSGQMGRLKGTSAALSNPWGHTEHGAREDAP